MFCGKCGNKIDGDSVFCSNCGERVAFACEVSNATCSLALQGLADKLWAEAVFAGVKTLTFFACFLIYFLNASDEVKDWILAVIFLADVILGIKEIFYTVGYVNQIKIKPVGIVNKYVALDFEFGLTWFFFRRHTKKFVLENKQAFLELEKQHLK